MLDDFRRLFSQVEYAEQIAHEPVSVHPQKRIHRAKHDEVGNNKEEDRNGRAIDEEKTEQKKLKN